VTDPDVLFARIRSQKNKDGFAVLCVPDVVGHDKHITHLCTSCGGIFIFWKARFPENKNSVVLGLRYHIHTGII